MNMQKVLLTFVFLSLTIGTPLFAINAQTSDQWQEGSFSGTRSVMDLTDEQFQKIMEKQCSNIQKKIGDLKTKITSKRAEIITKLDDLIVKIDNILVKLEGRGVDTSSLDDKVLALKTDIEELKTEISNAELTVADSFSCDMSKTEVDNLLKNIKESFSGVQRKITETRTSFTALKQAIVTIIPRS